MSLARHEAAGLLLLSMLDYLPTVRTASGLMPAAPGPQASAFVPCDACHGSGRVRGLQPCIICRDRKRAGKSAERVRHGCSLCLGCEGSGERRRRKQDEPYEAYSGLPMSELEREVSEASLSTVQRRVRGALAATEQPRDEIFWVREREAYRRAGSYAELERQLDWLRDRYPMRYELVMHWLTSCDDPLWSWADRALVSVDDTIRLLAAKMEGEIRVPSFVVKRMRGPGVELADLLPGRVLARREAA